ncbi:hypothetical protein HGD85_02910 [Rhodobacteraceae bacterium R_SAG10]|nr:hypothetical protein [Rhodobacteraceae bacterium R_SAG10]
MKRLEGENDREYIRRLEGRNRQRNKDCQDFADIIQQRIEEIELMDEIIKIQEGRVQWADKAIKQRDELIDQWSELAASLLPELGELSKAAVSGKAAELELKLRAMKQRKSADSLNSRKKLHARVNQWLADAALRDCSRFPDAEQKKQAFRLYNDAVRRVVNLTERLTFELTEEMVKKYGAKLVGVMTLQEVEKTITKNAVGTATKKLKLKPWLETTFEKNVGTSTSAS